MSFRGLQLVHAAAALLLTAGLSAPAADEEVDAVWSDVVIENAGTEDGHLLASMAYCLLTYTSKIELRTGSVRIQS